MSEKTKPQVTAADDDYSMEAVPESARKGFRSMFFVMLGFTFFSAGMSVGAKLGNGLDLNGFTAACVIGGVILSAYCGILAYIGSDTGMSMDLLCRRAFGKKVLIFPHWYLASHRSDGLVSVLPCFPFQLQNYWESINGF